MNKGYLKIALVLMGCKTQPPEFEIGKTQSVPNPPSQPPPPQPDANADTNTPANDAQADNDGSQMPDGMAAFADAGIPPWILATPEYGTLITATQGTIFQIMPQPTWVQYTAVSAAIQRQNGSTYFVLVYTKPSNMAFAEWMASAEISDAFISSQQVLTADNRIGFLYITNDHAAEPDVHVTLPSAGFVYYFYVATPTFTAPADFVNFVEGIAVQ